MKAWKCKADELQESNNLLEKSFKSAINEEMSTVLKQIEAESAKSINDIKQVSTQLSDEAVNERQQALNEFKAEYQTLLNQLNEQAADMSQAYQKGLDALDQTTHEIVNKQKINNHIFENGKFIFSNLIMVAIAVILIRALFYGVWEGLYLSNFYEWGSQWDWLKYTMWGLFALIIGIIAYYVYLFLKNNLNRP